MKIRRSLVSLALITGAIAAVLVMSPFGGRIAEAAPTLAGTPITNTATMTWGGGMSTNAAIGMPVVGTNYGGTWSGNNSTNVAPGTVSLNRTVFVNDGNLAVDFQFNASQFHTTTIWPWTYEFTNTAGGAHGLPLTVNMSAGAVVTTIWFRVDVPGAEVDSSFAQFKCVATCTNNTTSLATNYTGHNLLHYGGNMGKWAAGYGKVILTNTTGSGNTNWRVTVQAAIMVLTKTLLITNAGPFAGISSRPYPGGMLIWRLNYSNGGTVPATGVKIVDVFNTNNVTLKTDSMRSNTWASGALVYPAAAVLLTTAPADDPAASTNGTSVIFAPFTTSPLNGSTVGVGGKGAFYYINFVK